MTVGVRRKAGENFTFEREAEYALACLFFALLDDLVLQLTLQDFARATFGQFIQDDEFLWHFKRGEVSLKEGFDLHGIQLLTFLF